MSDGPQRPCNPPGHGALEMSAPLLAKLPVQPPKSHMASWAWWGILLLLYILGASWEAGWGSFTRATTRPASLRGKEWPITSPSEPTALARSRHSSSFKESHTSLDLPSLLYGHKGYPGGRTQGEWSFQSGTKRPLASSQHSSPTLPKRKQARSRTDQWKPERRGHRHQ